MLNHHLFSTLSVIWNVLPIRFKGCLAFIFVLFGLAILCQTLQPVLLSLMVSAVLKGEASWLGLGFCYAGLFFVARVLSEIQRSGYLWFEKQMVKRLSLHIIKEFLNTDFLQLKKKSSAEHAIIVDRGVRGISAVLYHGAFQVLPIILETFVALCIISLHVHIGIGMSCALIIILFVIVTYRISQKTHQKESVFFKTSTENFSLFSESLSFFELIRSFEVVQWIQRRYARANQKFVDEVMASVAPRVRGSYAQGGLLFVLMSFASVTIFISEADAHERVSELILVGGLLLQISSPLLQFSETYRFFLQGLSSSEQLHELMDIAKTQTSTKTGFRPLLLHHSRQTCYEFEGLVIPYNHPLHFDDFSLPQVSLLAIMGGSGSGKTSLGRVMAGLLEFSGSLRSIYRPHEVSFMTQNAQIFDTTLAENVCLGRSCRQEKLDRILSAAGFRANELRQLENRNLGENGAHISGGQKKRVGIARMLLTTPKLMIFDEPTAELDEETVNVLMDLLKKLSHQQSIMVITHSQKIASMCQTVISMEDVIRRVQ